MKKCKEKKERKLYKEQDIMQILGESIDAFKKMERKTY